MRRFAAFFVDILAESGHIGTRSGHIGRKMGVARDLHFIR